MSWNRELTGDTASELDRVLAQIETLGILPSFEIDLLTDAIARGSSSMHTVPQTVAAAAWRVQYPSMMPLDDNAVDAILDQISWDDVLAFSLVCKQLNQVRKARCPKMRTLARSTLRSVSLCEWAQNLGCPSSTMFPCWAEVTGLTGATGLNGRVCRVLGSA